MLLLNAGWHPNTGWLLSDVLCWCPEMAHPGVVSYLIRGASLMMSLQRYQLPISSCWVWLELALQTLSFAKYTIAKNEHALKNDAGAQLKINFWKHPPLYEKALNKTKTRPMEITFHFSSHWNIKQHICYSSMTYNL